MNRDKRVLLRYISGWLLAGYVLLYAEGLNEAQLELSRSVTSYFEIQKECSANPTGLRCRELFDRFEERRTRREEEPKKYQTLNDQKTLLKTAQSECLDKLILSSCKEMNAVLEKPTFKKSRQVSFKQISLDKNATLIYEKSCNLGESQSCYFLAERYKVNHNREKAIARYKDACNLDFTSACYALGIYLRKDKEVSIKYLKKACLSHHSLACKEFENLSL